MKLRRRGRGDTADLYFQNRGFSSQKEGRNETSDYHNAARFAFKIFDISDFSFRIIARMEFFRPFPIQNRQFKIQFVTILSVARVGFAQVQPG